MFTRQEREKESNMNEMPANNRRSRDSSAPLGSATDGRLRFLSGASNLTVHADPSIADLYRARFEGTAPGVRVEGGAVAIKYPRTLHPFDWRKRGADVVLNGSIPWGIGISGGLSRLEADLSRLRLDHFEVEGGASRVELLLAEPSGTVSIRFDGGVSDVTVRRPEGVAVRVLVGGGASNFTLDDQHFGAIGGQTRLESPDYAGATDRYEITITGGASNLTIDAR
jgi:hypothetical protein